MAMTMTSLLTAGAAAQSGRKQKRAETQPPVQGVNQPEARTQPEPEPVPEESREQKKGPGIMIMTGMTDAMIPLYFTDTASRGCVSELQRILRQAHDVREARNQTRSDAIKAAKEDPDYYIVLLELELDQFGTSMMGVNLRYTIFEPKTAKVLGVGNGFPTQPSSGSPIPPIGASRQQVYLDWAGRDVAYQVVKRLGWAGL